MYHCTCAAAIYLVQLLLASAIESAVSAGLLLSGVCLAFITTAVLIALAGSLYCAARPF